MKHKYPVVAVHYEDPSYYGGCYNVKSKEFTPAVVYIVGHLLREDDKQVTIAQEYFGDAESADDVRYVGVVPKVCILEMETLCEQDKD